MSSSDGLKLPHDLVVEILKRLPVRSLPRFKCVCQSWLSTIGDPHFVALHLNHSALHASNWYLARLEWCNFRNRVSLFCGPSMSRIDAPFGDPPNCYGFVGSCNGLICVTDFASNGYGRLTYLWNLFTRKHKAVGPSCLERKFLSGGTACTAIGFGFDGRSNDYKIVRILYCPDDHHRTFCQIKPRVQIYSLSTDSWRSLECEVPAFSRNEPAVFFNGNLHWLVFKHDDLRKEGKYGSIVLFDIASEVFDEMAPPEEFLHAVSVGSEVFVSVLNDLLAMFIGRGISWNPVVCSIWVLRDYAVPESWTKLYTFEDIGLDLQFDHLTWSGKFLMNMVGREPVSWNPIMGQFASIISSRPSNFVAVVESLVSL